MAAIIEKDEVGFPMGELLSIVESHITCTIHPDYQGGKPTESGEIRIILPYIEATVESSGTTKPRERMFSICNQLKKNEIFNKKGECLVRFITDSRKVVSDPKNAPKELQIIITGEGPKKNSMA
jgi:hypothetical protein